jgi:hypothetical protein
MNKCHSNTELSSLEETRCQFNGGRCAIKLGIDVHQDFYVVVEQVGGSNPKPAQRFCNGRPVRAWTRCWPGAFVTWDFSELPCCVAILSK